MKILKRAILYITRKWKKSFMIFSIILAVSTLVLSGLAILDAQEAKSTELRGTTGASFSVSRNLSTGGWSSGTNGSYSTQEYLKDEMLEKIAQVNGIKGYNATITTILSLYDEDNQYLERINPIGNEYVDCQYYSYGCIDTQYSSLFLSNTFSLVEGHHITAEDKNAILISKDIADKHNYKIGDKVQAVNNLDNNDPIKALEIVGIFEVIADKTDKKNNYDESSYYDYSCYSFVDIDTMKGLLVNYEDSQESDSADFFVSDPQKLEQIIQEVQNIDSINWNNFKITANNEVYEKSADSMSNVSTLITAMIAVMTIISTVVVALILSMWIKSRKREIGVMLAVGISKLSISIQYICETLFIAVFAFMVTYPFSKLIAGSLGNLFGKTSDTIIVTFHHLVTVIIFGIILLILSVVFACIPIMRYKPRDILSQTE